MHENREISCTPWSHDQGRSAKAINRTADMNVQEKSDCAVVPMNQPNKEGQMVVPTASVGSSCAECSSLSDNGRPVTRFASFARSFRADSRHTENRRSSEAAR